MEEKKAPRIRGFGTVAVAGPQASGVVLEFLLPLPKEEANKPPEDHLEADVRVFLTIVQAKDLTQAIADRLQEVANMLQAQQPKSRH